MRQIVSVFRCQFRRLIAFGQSFDEIWIPSGRRRLFNPRETGGPHDMMGIGHFVKIGISRFITFWNTERLSLIVSTYL